MVLGWRHGDFAHNVERDVAHHYLCLFGSVTMLVETSDDQNLDYGLSEDPTTRGNRAIKLVKITSLSQKQFRA